MVIAPGTQAWAAFLISSALIVGTLLPVIGYGYIFLYLPVFLFFGCDSARTAADCLGTELYPFMPPALALLALIWCRMAVARRMYMTSIVVAASTCTVSWVLTLRWVV